jgi:4-amino-4-deoxy-L-arabinose transferase-like glycosyltransferase
MTVREDPPLSSETRARNLSPKMIFALTVALAAAVRFYLLWQYYCISSDGIHYIEAARHFYFGDIQDGLGSVYPPAYPSLIAAAYPLIGDWELSGQIISIICGVALLFPLYALCRDLYGEKVAALACFLAAISPYLARYAIHVRTESPFFLLSTFALLLFCRGITQGKASRFFYGGLVAGFAYLVRPEAIGFLVIVPVALIVTWWFKRGNSAVAVGKPCLLLFVGFFLFALPYIAYLSGASGQWGAVSRKAGLTFGIAMKASGLLENEDSQTLADLESLTLLQFVTRHPVLYAKKVLLDLLPSIGIYFEALHYSYVPFLLVGLFLILREKFWLRRDLLLLGFFVFYLVGFALIFVRRRYSIQLVAISLPWTALGLLWCWTSLQRIVSLKTFRIIAAAVVLIFLAGTLPKTLKPISPEKAYVREAGRYLKKLSGPGDLNVFVFDDRITFYGDAKAILLSDLDESKLLDQIRRRKAFYLATEVKPWQERFPKIALDPAGYGLVIDKEFRGLNHDRLIIFKLA